MILGPPSASRETVLANLPRDAHPFFKGSILPVLWAVAEEHGIDPVGMVAQSGKETGWGRFEGKVKPWFYNPAGIKVRHVGDVEDVLRASGVPESQIPDHPLVHQQFPNWYVGALAHAQHLQAYAGVSELPLIIVDPRYLVVSTHSARTWADLGGRWAPSPTYGTEIEAIMRRLRGEP